MYIVRQSGRAFLQEFKEPRRTLLVFLSEERYSRCSICAAEAICQSATTGEQSLWQRTCACTYPLQSSHPYVFSYN